MNFLFDAQLPVSLAYRLRKDGHDVIHTLDLPRKNRATDKEINEISLQEKRIVVTKDEDFVNSFILQNKPYKLLLISTGNIKNNELENLILLNIRQLIEAFEHHDFIELNRASLTIHV